MKRCKKMLCMVLCILMVLGMFAGCNQQTPVETTEATETIETEAPVFVDPIVVTEPSSLPTEDPAETIEYTITYEVNGGELPEIFQTVYSLANPVVLPVPIKEGSLFFGWFEEEDFSGNVVLTTAGQTGDKTYYAKWEISEATEPTEAEEEKKQAGTGSATGGGSQGGQQTTTHVHEYTVVKEVEENCYDDGYIQYKCKCGETYKEYIARSHKWGRWVIVREATDFEEGMRKRTCTECGVVDREKIAKQPHAHFYVATEIKATCTEDGYIRYECACGEIYTGAEFEATGHDYEATIVAPTVEAQGYTLHKCKNCEDEYKDTFTEKLPPSELEDPSLPST